VGSWQLAAVSGEKGEGAIRGRRLFLPIVLVLVLSAFCTKPYKKIEDDNDNEHEHD
jgi:hypothetical protein